MRPPLWISSSPFPHYFYIHVVFLLRVKFFSPLGGSSVTETDKGEKVQPAGLGKGNDSGVFVV